MSDPIHESKSARRSRRRDAREREFRIEEERHRALLASMSPGERMNAAGFTQEQIEAIELFIRSIGRE